MTDPTWTKQEFGPAPRGSGWIFSLMMVLGSGLCTYLAVDLFSLLRPQTAFSDTDMHFVYGLFGISGLFLLAAWGFWFFPWSRAHLTIDPKGLTLRVTGLGAIPETDLLWNDVSMISVWSLPKSASRIEFVRRDQRAVGARLAAFRARPEDILRSIGHHLDTSGHVVDGPDFVPPPLGRRRWKLNGP